MSAAAALSAETSADHRANIVQAELPSEKNPRTKLYPPLEPYKTADLEVDEVHTIHYELSGNAQGKPVFVVHGGPGGGICAYYRSFFDPTAYNIVTYDQRGCGQSTPAACLKNNTTWSLVDDVEKLRKELGFDKIMLFGGSWGSCLSMAYAQKYPERVTELVLRGIFTLRRSELQWFYQVGDQKGVSGFTSIRLSSSLNLTKLCTVAGRTRQTTQISFLMLPRTFSPLYPWRSVEMSFLPITAA